MAPDTAKDVYEQVVLALSEEEQDRLLALMQVARRARDDEPEITLGRSWLEIRGIAPSLLGGEGAQEWVSRGRREADAARAKHVPRAYESNE